VALLDLVAQEQAAVQVRCSIVETRKLIPHHSQTLN
jgi:hypothetical protein